MRDRGIEHFDAVIVGSGFGGSVMASRLAAAGWSVCVLERGLPYPPLSFPRSPFDMARNSWDPSEGTYGLFDFWSFSGLSCVVSSGLGGGSLIYSNVMLRKPPAWFVDEDIQGGGHETWPVTYDDIEGDYTQVEERIGLQRYPLDVKPYSRTEKTHALLEAAEQLRLEHELLPLAVTFANKDQPPVPGQPIDRGATDNLHKASRSTCRLVGECNIGCNSGSKNSLDFTYLSDAAEHGADIRTLREVRSFRPCERGFAVDYVEHHREGTSKDVRHCRMTANRLILSAGTFGTTYLLMRNRAAFPGMSPTLGSQFSSNGDFLGLALNARRKTAAGRQPRLLRPSFGPVITAAAKVRDHTEGGAGRGFYIEDGGYPDLVSWMVDESPPVIVPRLSRFLASRLLGRLRNSSKTNISRALRDVLGSAILTETSSPLAGMGRDVPGGRFRLRDGLLDLDWNAGLSRPYFERVDKTMREMSHRLGATYLSNVVWLNLLVSSHPLGGCSMARDPEHGVVDTYGQVFGWPGLVVADGSVMPGPVGANPSLTIAALANRSASHLIDLGPGAAA